MESKLSRRGLLRLAGVSSTGVALSACGVEVADAPTPPVRLTPAPTTISVATALKLAPTEASLAGTVTARVAMGMSATSSAPTPAPTGVSTAAATRPPTALTPAPTEAPAAAVTPTPTGAPAAVVTPTPTEAPAVAAMPTPMPRPDVSTTPRPLAGLADIVQPATPTTEAFSQYAFEMRRLAVESGDQAYGAIVVKGDRVVGLGPSRVVVDRDATAHAEMEAIRDASRRLGTGDLSDCVMYSTSRPCGMCENAAYWARLARMVYGSNATDAGAPRYCSR
jgi:tRNA(Arg) A34 adenosine deaminase TadA